MTFTSIITGQWRGYFEYGYSYGLAGERATFILTLQERAYGEFKGSCFEIEGTGINSEIAAVEGFTEGDFISFIKTYPNGSLDKTGNNLKRSLPVHYAGNYNWQTGVYAGRWEIIGDADDNRNGSLIVMGSGKWQISKI